MDRPAPFSYSIDQYVADIWDQCAQQDFYPVPPRFHPYYEDAQSMGNVYQPFVSFVTYRAQHGALSDYSVWRLDGPTQALAQGLLDKAIAAETNGFAGQVCIDRNRGAISALLDSDYGEGDWDLYQAAIFSGLAGFTITVPATVTVPQGTSQATFTINSSLVTSATTGTISATRLGATAHSSLTLYPTLYSLSVSPSSVPGGAANATLVMWQGANAPAGGWPVNLSSSNLAVACVPATVTAPAGTRYFQVPVTTFPQCTNTSVTLTASSGLSTLNTTLTVTPAPPTSLSFVSSVRGGTPVTATVYVSYPACSSGLSVALQSSNPSVARVPGSVTITGGQKSATFMITTFS